MAQEDGCDYIIVGSLSTATGFLYCGVLVWSCLNIYKFLFIQGRWRTARVLLIFYFWVTLVAIARIFLFSKLTNTYFKEQCDPPPYFLRCEYNIPSKIATAASINFGLTQVLIMQEVYRMLKQSLAQVKQY